MKTFMSTFIFCLIGSLLGAQSGTGEVKGIISDSLTNEPIDGAVVQIYNGLQALSMLTDEKGEYSIKFIPSGKYEMAITRLGYNKSSLMAIRIKAGKTEFINLSIALKSGKVFEYEARNKYIDKILALGAPGLMKIIDADEIIHSANERGIIPAMVALVPRVLQPRDGGSLHFSGSRSDAALFIIDGIKVIGDSQMPNSGIADVQVYVGGIPAQFGDTVGGVVVINSKSFFNR